MIDRFPLFSMLLFYTMLNKGVAASVFFVTSADGDLERAKQKDDFTKIVVNTEQTKTFSYHL